MPLPFLLATAASALAPATTPERIDLEGAWRLTQDERKIDVPARVPGVVQTDLMRAGLIPDPYLGTNEKAVQWVSDLPWSYARTVDVPAAFLAKRHVVLRCEGLDTFATVRINGREVAKTDDMYRTWEFDAKPYLRAGANTVQIDFEALASFLKRNEDRPKRFDRPVQEGGKAYVRKSAFQGGWDFAPRLLTSGIWRGIGLVGWDAARLTGVGVAQDHSKKGQVAIDVSVDADVAGATSARTVVLFKGRRIAEGRAPVAGGRASTALVVENPQLWWPNTMGPQNLYDLRVELLDPQGRVLDRTARRIGLRTVTWIPKTKENPLALVVNGRRFFAKGSNWVPTDSLLRVDRAQIQRLVGQAVDANMNLMRVWGGGYYETDDFFDACDEKGLLVWFEFGYACSPYPSFDPQWLAGAREEAKDVVCRIQSHPSIAVYSGNNEVTDRITDATTAGTMSREEYALLFHTTLRDVVREYAPDAAYTPGSPEVGDTHYWSVWHGSEGFDAYLRLHGFMSEYGYQAMPVPRSIAAYTTPEERASVDTPAMQNHQKNWRDAHALILSTMRRAYRKPKDFDSTAWLSQIQQADGIAMGVEHWRRDWPNSTASLVWQFNDPWPVTSWSMVDYYGRPKALYYRLKRAYAPVALSGLADPKTGVAELWIASDRSVAQAGRLEWTLTRLDGTAVEKGGAAVAIPAGTTSVRALAKDLKATIDREGAAKLLLWATLRVPGEPDSNALVTFAKAKELDLVEPGIEAVVAPRGKGYRVTLTSARPALDAWIELKDMDADLSDNFLHLRPGVPATIDVVPGEKTSRDDVRRALVVRSLFDTYLPGTEATPTVRPDAQGRIVATADDADVSGDGPVLELGAPSNLGVWRSLDGAVRWTVRDAKAGTYAATALVAAPAGDAGGAFEVEVDGSHVAATVPVTKGWTDYIEIPLGTLTIAKDGTATLTLRPTSKPHENLMNLRALTLTPQNP